MTKWEINCEVRMGTTGFFHESNTKPTYDEIMKEYGDEIRNNIMEHLSIEITKADD